MHDEEADTARVLGGRTGPSHQRKPSDKTGFSFKSYVDNAFDDKRVTIACIAVWFVVCLVGFTWLGIFGSEYMRIGPSDTLTYLGMRIDTMSRYLFVVGFVVISTAINDFASDAISPWIQNTVMDHKSRTIPYTKFTIMFITQTWSLYCGTMSVASIALVFAQFDLIMIRLIVDLFVNQYTIRRFLANKTHDPYRYHSEFLNEDETDILTDNTSVGDTTKNNSPRQTTKKEKPHGVFRQGMHNHGEPLSANFDDHSACVDTIHHPDTTPRRPLVPSPGVKQFKSLDDL
jgi:hypothetical protein